MTTREKELLAKEYLDHDECDELVASVLRIATRTWAAMSRTAQLGAIVNFMLFETNRVDIVMTGPGSIICFVGEEKLQGMAMAAPENAAAETLIELIKRRPQLIR